MDTTSERPSEYAFQRVALGDKSTEDTILEQMSADPEGYRRDKNASVLYDILSKTGVRSGDSHLHHHDGCRPSDDPREACDCDAIIIEAGAAIIRRRGEFGASIDEVVIARARKAVQP